MTISPHSGIVDFGTFTPPEGATDGIQGEVPAPLIGQETYVLTATGWAPGGGGSTGPTGPIGPTGPSGSAANVAELQAQVDVIKAQLLTLQGIVAGQQATRVRVEPVPAAPVPVAPGGNP